MHISQPSYNRGVMLIIGSIAALAGLLFGLDVGVIAGALKFITHAFGTPLTTGQQEWVVSSLLFGAVVGSLMANPLSRLLGRRRALLISGAIFVVFALLSAQAQSYQSLVIYRVLLGIAIGVSSFTAPIYLSEIAPKRIRGSLVTLFQLMITIGILLAALSDTYFSYTGNWRAMLGIIAIPAAIMFFGIWFLPYSPRWLMLVGKTEKAKEILQTIFFNPQEVEQELHDIESNLNRQQSSGASAFKSKFFRKVLFLGVCLQAIQILTGMNTMIYYAPKIYALAGYASTSSQMWGTVLLDSLNVLTTVLAFFVVDRWGRRPVLFFGLTFMIAGMIALGSALHMINAGHVSTLLQHIAVVGMLSFIFGFAISLGPVIWLMCPEIFPLRNRDVGVMFTTGINWLAAATLGGLFLTVINTLGPANTFYLFAGICIASTVFIYFFAPETKNVPLETIEKHLFDGKPLRYLGRQR